MAALEDKSVTKLLEMHVAAMEELRRIFRHAGVIAPRESAEWRMAISTSRADDAGNARPKPFPILSASHPVPAGAHRTRLSMK